MVYALSRAVQFSVGLLLTAAFLLPAFFIGVPLALIGLMGVACLVTLVYADFCATAWRARTRAPASAGKQPPPISTTAPPHGFVSYDAEPRRSLPRGTRPKRAKSASAPKKPAKGGAVGVFNFPCPSDTTTNSVESVTKINGHYAQRQHERPVDVIGNYGGKPIFPPPPPPSPLLYTPLWSRGRYAAGTSGYYDRPPSSPVSNAKTPSPTTVVPLATSTPHHSTRRQTHDHYGHRTEANFNPMATLPPLPVSPNGHYVKHLPQPWSSKHGNVGGGAIGDGGGGGVPGIPLMTRVTVGHGPQ